MAYSQAELERIARQELAAEGGSISSRPDLEEIARQELVRESDDPGYGYVSSDLRQLGQGLTGGFADEAEAGVRALGRKSFETVKGLFTGEESPALSDLYGERLEDIRGQNKAFEKANPKSAIALQLLGGLPTALVMPGGMIKGGATAGALYGFGSGEDGFKDRATQAVIGGALGGGLGLAGEAAISGASKLAKTDTARKLAEILGSQGRKLLTSERGAVGQAGGSAAPPEDISDALKLLGKRLAGSSDEIMTQARGRQGGAAAEGSPMFLAEAFHDPTGPVMPSSVQRLARTIANYEPSMEISQRAIHSRAIDAPERVQSMLDDFMPARAEANEAGAEKATKMLRDMMAARSKAAKPGYDKLEGTIYGGEKIEQALKNPRIQAAIKATKRDYPELADLPDNSFAVLQKSREFLFDAAEKAKPTFAAKGDPWGHKLEKEGRRLLTDAMDEITPDFQGTRKIFETSSQEIAKHANGPIGALADLAEGKVGQAGAKIFKMKGAEIAELREQLGEETLSGMIRGHIDDLIANHKDGWNAAGELVSRPANRDRIVGALGEENGERLITSLRRENTYHQFRTGRDGYDTGSPTQTNLADAAEFGKEASLLQKLSKALIRPKVTAEQYIDKVFTERGLANNAPLAQELARILFDPDTGAKALQDLSPYLEKLNRHYGGVDWLARGGRKGTGYLAGRSRSAIPGDSE